MKPYRTVSVRLLKADQKQITELLSKGTHSARVLSEPWPYSNSTRV